MPAKPRSTIFLTAAGLVLVFAVARLATVVCSRRPQPHVVVEGSGYLGRIPTSQPIVHRFTLTNAGNAELLLLGTKSSCECVVAQLPRRVLEPGESMPLEVTFTARRPGQRKQQVVLETNDPKNPAMVLTLLAAGVDSQETNTATVGRNDMEKR